MSDVKWIQLSVDIFKDDKFKRIQRKYPQYRNECLLVWLAMLCMAGKSNADGALMTTRVIPSEADDIAEECGIDSKNVEELLTIFIQHELIDCVNGRYYIINWSKYQATEGMNKIRQDNARRQAEYRLRRKREAFLETEKNSDNVTVTLPSHNKALLEEEIEEEKEIDIYTGAKIPSNKERETVVIEWNKLSSKGIRPITKISAGSQRCKLLNGRLSEYGLDNVLKAVRMVGNSKFLLGHNNSAWQITFDWFIKPSNFPKVLEGNYSEGCKPLPEGFENFDCTKYYNEIIEYYPLVTDETDEKSFKEVVTDDEIAKMVKSKVLRYINAVQVSHSEAKPLGQLVRELVK